MSKDNKKGDKDFRPKNFGPSGFAMYDYLGKGKDHSSSWLKFKKNLKGAILTHKLDKLMEKIIDRGVQPVVPPTNKAALYEQAPRKKILVSELLGETDQLDLGDDDEQQQVLHDESTDSKSEFKINGKVKGNKKPVK